MKNLLEVDAPTPLPGAPGPLGGRAKRPRWRSLADSADTYQPTPELVEAVNAALDLCAPLLLTGDPGTGKTQVAHYLRHKFGLPKSSLFAYTVRSTTTAADLLGSYDNVRYFRDATDPRLKGQELDRATYLDKGVLWQAFLCGGPCIVLIDEIDKAPRDLPNDLLDVLDQGEFRTPVTGQPVIAPDPPPFVVITSNAERRLPEPFLRRCVFHHIEFDEALVRRAVDAHLVRDRARPDLDDPLMAELREPALAQFWRLRGEALRKKPGTGELLAWMERLRKRAEAAHAAHREPGLAAFLDTLKGATLPELPDLGTLVKDAEDLEILKPRT